MNNKSDIIHYYENNGKTACGIKIVLKSINEMKRYETGEKYNDALASYQTYIDDNGIISTGWGNCMTTKEQLKKITCMECIKKIKTYSYYCLIHGNVGGKEVTFDERCIYCGERV